MKTTTLSALILMSLSLFANEENPAPQQETTPACPKGVTSIIDLRHRESGGVGYSQGYTSLDYFLTAQGDKWEFLFNLRGHIFNDDYGAGNAGVGMRFPIQNEKYLIGGNLYYDCRQSHHLFTNQIGGGFEWLGPYVDFRINGYLPIGKQRNIETKQFEGFSGNNVFVKQRLKGALPNLEAEIGTPLPKYFYFAVGSYYLFQQDKDGIKLGNAWGGRARGAVNLGRYFTLEGVVTYDKIFHTRVQGVLSLNIPLGKWKTANHGERCLRQVPIMRNEIIPIQSKRKTKLLTSSSGNDPFQFFFVNNLARLPGDGSIERPFSTLKEAEANSNPGDVIYVFAGDGTPRNMDEGIVLKDGQVIAGSGMPLDIGGVIVPPQTPGENPVITNVHGDQPIVGNPGDSDLNSLIILAPWDYIFGNWGYNPPADINLNPDAPDDHDPEFDEWVMVEGQEEAAPPAPPPAPSNGNGGGTWLPHVITDYFGGGTK